MTSAQTPTLAEVINRAVRLALARMVKVRIGRVEKFDASKGVADVKPLQHEVMEEDGKETTFSMPVVPNVPVMSLGGGDFHLTLPVAQGDECLLVCVDRSIDLWYGRGGEGDPIDLRRHNITDAIALVGLRNSTRALDEWPTDRVELGKQGGVRVAVKEDGVHLGVDSGADASELAAVASKVKSELDALKNKLDSLITKFNTHTHTVTTSGPPLAHTGVTAVPLSTETPANPVQDVKCDKVYIK